MRISGTPTELFLGTIVLLLIIRWALRRRS